ncbi:MAG TPA: HAD-IIIA family hydrolase, partial [Gammaproteobacteria bacterium]|nr:HAD-IIIA family hydrolase [Gammaproteobacteria bacterium]
MSADATPLVILDRDGVINVDRVDYVRRLEEWQPLPGSLEAIAQLSRAGITVAVATNQSGIGRGVYELSSLQQIHELLQRQVEALGGR